MMKKYFLLFIFLTAVNLQGQDIPTDPFDGFRVKTIESSTLSKVEGSPFWNDEFQRGVLIIDGKEPINAFMRYDVNHEIIEIKLKPTDDQVFYLEPNLSAEFQFGGDVYNARDLRVNGKTISGIFIDHYKGENFSLLEKPTIELTPAKKARTGYDEDEPAKIEIDSKFFIVENGGEITEVEVKHRDVRKAFDSEVAESYLKDNRIRDIKDLKAFVAFLDENQK